MQVFPFAMSYFDINAFKMVLDDDQRAAVDRAKNKFEALGHGDWRKHVYISFYIDVPNDALEILTNANMFTIEHDRGIGLLSGSVFNFQSFVTTYSVTKATVQERSMANIFYAILRNCFDMFKEYRVKQLGDRTFTMER